MKKKKTAGAITILMKKTVKVRVPKRRPKPRSPSLSANVRRGLNYMSRLLDGFQAGCPLAPSARQTLDLRSARRWIGEVTRYHGALTMWRKTNDARLAKRKEVLSDAARNARHATSEG